MDDKQKQLELLKLEEEELNLQLQLAEAENAQQTTPPEPKVSSVESALGGLQQGATANFADEIGGGVTAALHLGSKVLPYDSPYESTQQAYTQSRDDSRQMYNEQAEANPAAFMGGNLAGAIMMPGGAGLAKQVAMGAAQGLGAGEGDLSEQADSAIFGAGMGAGGAGVAKGFSKLGQMAGKGADRTAETAAGLNRTQGQREKLAAMIAADKVAPGEAGRVIRDEGLLGMSPKSTRDKINEYLKTKINPKLKDMKAKAAPVNPEAISRRIAAEADEYTGVQAQPIKDKLLRQADAYAAIDNSTPAQLSKIVDENGVPYVTKAATPNTARIPATEIAADKTLVGRQVDDFLTDVPSKDAGKSMYKALAKEVDDSVARSGQSLDEFKDVNRQAHLLIPAEEAANAKAANLDGLNMLSLRGSGLGILGAVAGGSQGDTTGDRVKNAALGFAGGKLAKTYGPSVMAKSLGSVESILANGGKFKTVLDRALTRGGPNAVRTTHYLLMQSDPEYRQSQQQETEE